jgi:hypothetical protein
LDGLVSQTGVSGFGRIETSFAKEDDCSTSRSNIDDEDNDTNDEYDDKELLLEFKKTHNQAYEIAKEICGSPMFS